MKAIFIIMFTCGFLKTGYCYQKSEPMPIEACEEHAKTYNANKVFLSNFAYCEAIKPEQKGGE